MSKKEQYIQNTHQAKNNIEKEMVKLELALNGTQVDEVKLSNKFECDFGQWFHQAYHLKEIFGPQLYEKIDFLHSEWHSIYGKIYAIYFQEKKKGFFSKLLHKEPSELEKDKARAYYDDLKKLAAELEKTLEVCERRLSALGESKFT